MMNLSIIEVQRRVAVQGRLSDAQRALILAHPARRARGDADP
jgi:hypothetical protein